MRREELFDAMPEAWKDEARERWGETASYREADRRMRGYSDAQLAEMRAELDAIEAGFAELLASGVPPGDGQAGEMVERARRHIDRWWYPCDRVRHASVAQLYTSDPRFADHYERRAQGLAVYVRDAICARLSENDGGP